MRDIYWPIDALELCEMNIVSNFAVICTHQNHVNSSKVVITVTNKKVKGQTVGVLTPFAHYWLAGASQPNHFNGRFFSYVYVFRALDTTIL